MMNRMNTNKLMNVAAMTAVFASFAAHGMDFLAQAAEQARAERIALQSTQQVQQNEAVLPANVEQQIQIMGQYPAMTSEQQVQAMEQSRVIYEQMLKQQQLEQNNLVAPMSTSVVQTPLLSAPIIPLSNDPYELPDGTWKSSCKCEETFATEYSAKRHMKIHTGEKPFICPISNCERRFAAKATLKRHERTHTQERPFKCKYPNCTYKFADKRNLNKHHTLHVNGSYIKPFEEKNASQKKTKKHKDPRGEDRAYNYGSAGSWS